MTVEVEQAFAGSEVALEGPAREANQASEGALGSLLLFVFGVALVTIGQSLIHAETPVVAYVALAELLFAAFVQEPRTVVRHGLAFSAGVALGLSASRDWFGLAISMGVYVAVTALRFSHSPRRLVTPAAHSFGSGGRSATVTTMKRAILCSSPITESPPPEQMSLTREGLLGQKCRANV